MTQQDKELLFKACCMYLPYSPIFDGKRKGWQSYECNMHLCLDDLRSDKFEHIKLHLRPLSTIDQDQEINGEVFNPMSVLEKLVRFNGHWDDLFWLFDDSHGEPLKPHDLIGVPFYVFEELLKWHFDVFGLFDKGLAEPIKID